ncbi:hypothetical protein Ciccas_003093 [Cichlidogyrus casuarinus]|uniref:Mitogen-activated protein kinase kinase kinase kinase n=1 Tax=Cichlidogyrus casuarinus TaxID=1844966 RepID=A0ABD2QFC2_9PLAT
MNHPKLDYLQQFVQEGDPSKAFRLVENLGSGTYGEVFKAISRTTNVVYAVKKLRIDLKEDIRGMCQEINTLRDLHHPNIVNFHEAYRRGNKLWIIMEYCGGKSMQDIYLSTRNPIEECCIAYVTRETLNGLNFMHRKGRIHRDIKGANILLTDDGRVKIADFGVAAQLNSSMAKRSTVIGTPYWMAPEVASAAQKNVGYDAKCDIWAVGITAIEYAELEPPLFEHHPLKVLNMLADRNYRPPRLKKSNWSDKFKSFLQYCLIKNPKNRPDAQELLMNEFLTDPKLSVNSTLSLLSGKLEIEQNERNAYSAKKSRPVGNVPAKPVSAPSNPPKQSIIPSSHGSNVLNGTPWDEVSPKRSFQDKGFFSEVMDEIEKHCSLSTGPKDEQKTKCQNDSIPTGSPKSVPIERRDISQFVTAPKLPKFERKLEHIYHCGVALPREPPSRSSNGYSKLAVRSPRASNATIHRAPEAFTATDRGSFYENDEELLCFGLQETGNENEQVSRQSESGEAKTNGNREGEVRLLKTPTKRLAPQPPSQAPPLPPRGGTVSAPSETVQTGDSTSSSSCDADGTSQQGTLTGAPPRPPPPRSGTALAQRSATSGGNVARSHSSGAGLSDMGVPKSQNETSLNTPYIDQGLGVPPTPKVLMGACFMLIFEGCPLKINSTATWVHPIKKCQFILFGTNDGIYFLNLANTADAELQLLVPKCCVWLTVIKDTMMSLSGRGPCLYSHNLLLLMKNADTMNQRSTAIISNKLLPRRFQPTRKVPNSKGCYIANIIRNPGNGAKYLCAAIEKSIVLMEWYNPQGTFIEIKRVLVPCMPSPVLNFDLIIPNDHMRPYPLVCLGVFRHVNWPNFYQLHLIDLNDEANDSWETAPKGDPIPVVKVIQLEYNVIMICFQEEAVVVNLQGKVKHLGNAELKFGTTVENVVCLRDSILAFHTHGLRGISFEGTVTQDIHDDNRIYRLLGNDKNTVVEGRLASNPMSHSNIYLLAGHTDSY